MLVLVKQCEECSFSPPPALPPILLFPLPHFRYTASATSPFREEEVGPRPSGAAEAEARAVGGCSGRRRRQRAKDVISPMEKEEEEDGRRYYRI